LLIRAGGGHTHGLQGGAEHRVQGLQVRRSQGWGLAYKLQAWGKPAQVSNSCEGEQ